MPLPAAPPRFSSWSAMLASIKEGETGWRVFALQAALGSVGRHTSPDGIFGPKTKRQVKGFQSNNGLTSDGIAGGATQAALLKKISHRSHDSFSELPDGLLRGYAEAEGANLLAATNWFTPAGGTPGVDCGPVQWRQYGPPFQESKLRKAFSPEASFAYASQILLDRIEEFNRRRSSLSDTMVLRLALLAHNAPFLADQFVRNGRLSTPSAIAGWTVKTVDSHGNVTSRYTHSEWLNVYPDKLMRYAKW